MHDDELVAWVARHWHPDLDLGRTRALDPPEHTGGSVAEENLRLRQELLVVRDDLIGHEARLGEALGRIELLESDLARYQDAVADADRLLGTRTGRLLRAWHRLRALLRP